MKIILKQQLDNLGKPGDVVNVSDGYARNYLFPKKLAIPATQKNVRSVEHEKRLIQLHLEKEKRAAQTLASKIEASPCTITKKVGEQEKIFGSVTTIDIEENLRSQGIIVDRKNILLEDPIKNLGVYTVPIRLHPEITANLKVWVVEK